MPAGPKDGTPLLGEDCIGLEARLAEADHQSVKLWLRLLSCSTQIETEIRKRLRAEFGITLARFDYLAQLHRHPEGLRMNALSRYLMVTGGNVTGLTDELVKEALVERLPLPEDGRGYRVALTRKGRRVFERIAAVHEAWVVELFGDIAPAQKTQLFDLLGRMRVRFAERQQGEPSAAVRRTRRANPSGDRA